MPAVAQYATGAGSSGQRKLHGEVYRDRGKRAASGTPRKRQEEPGRPSSNGRPGTGRQVFGAGGPRATTPVHQAQAGSPPIPVPLSRIHAALERSNLERAGKLGRSSGAAESSAAGHPSRSDQGAAPEANALQAPGEAGADRETLPPRPTTPCMNRSAKPVRPPPPPEPGGAGHAASGGGYAGGADDSQQRTATPRHSHTGTGLGEERRDGPSRPSTQAPGRTRANPSKESAGPEERTEWPSRPTAPCMNNGNAPPHIVASDERSEPPPRPTTPCMYRSYPSPTNVVSDERSELPPRPTTPCMNRTYPSPTTAVQDERSEIPPRPSTPCMNRSYPSPAAPVSDERCELPPRPTTPCMNRSYASPSAALADERSELPPRPSTPRMNRAHPSPAPAASSMDDRQEIPLRPATPCMNRGADGARKKRSSSAGRSGSRGVRPASGSVGARMSQLESRLLGERQRPVEDQGSEIALRGSEQQPQQSGQAQQEQYRHQLQHATDARQSRPVSSGGGRARASSMALASAAAARAPASLLEEALAMCRQARTSGTGSAATTCNSTVSGFVSSAETQAQEQVTSYLQEPSSPRPDELARPPAPTPEQTNHWLRDLEHPDLGSTSKPPEAAVRAAAGIAGAATEFGCPSPEPDDSSVSVEQCMRPRSPTPTKMLAWGEEEDGQDVSPRSASHMPRAHYGSPSDDEDVTSRGDHSDGLINRLIEACQMDDVRRAFGIYERLRRMRVPLYEGVYKLIIECCVRTQQLGHGIQFYETLKNSGQRVASRLVILLIEACAREQHSDKVHALWKDWCPPHEALDRGHSEALFVTVSALIRTMSPDLAFEALSDAVQRSDGQLMARLGDVEVEVEEVLELVESAASEAQLNGAGQLGDSLLASYRSLETLLLQILDEAAGSRDATAVTGGAGGAGAAAPPTPSVEDSAARPSSRRGWDAEDELLMMDDVDLDLELAAM